MLRKGQKVWDKSGREYSVLMSFKDSKGKEFSILESLFDDCVTTMVRMVRMDTFDEYFSKTKVYTITVKFTEKGNSYSYFVDRLVFLKEGEILYSIEHRKPVIFICQGGVVAPSSPQHPIKFLRFNGEI